uniref:Uncharacterized protein n=1 Tax=Cacopsylla melanoneura TaxID=428564 RepID=A0A8D8LX97_9HEMI
MPHTLPQLTQHTPELTLTTQLLTSRFCQNCRYCEISVLTEQYKTVNEVYSNAGCNGQAVGLKPMKMKLARHHTCPVCCRIFRFPDESRFGMLFKLKDRSFLQGALSVQLTKSNIASTFLLDQEKVLKCYINRYLLLVQK